MSALYSSDEHGAGLRLYAARAAPAGGPLAVVAMDCAYLQGLLLEAFARRPAWRLGQDPAAADAAIVSWFSMAHSGPS